MSPPADDFVEHQVAPGLAPTKEGVRQFFSMYMEAFSDMRMDLEDVVDFQAIDIVRFGDDGLAHEHWGVLDALAMMQQLGAVPEGAPA